MKRRISVRLISLAAAAALLSGCTPAPIQPSEPPAQASTVPAAYTPGTYSVEGPGRNGPMTVEVTFDADGITNISVPEHSESIGIGDIALEKISQRIIDTQSLSIDALSTATVTSRCLMLAVGKAIDQAGGSASEWQKKPSGITAQAPVTVDADVVILGGGGAGLSAAVAAAENGAQVVLVEKTAMLGGNTLRAGGHFNAVVEGNQESIEMTPAKIETVKNYIAMEPKNDIMARWQTELAAEFADYEASGVSHLFDSIYLHMLQTYSDGDFYGNPELIENLCREAPVTYRWLEELGYPWPEAPRIITGSLWERTNSPTTYNGGYGFFDILTKHIEKEQLPITIYYEVAAQELLQKDGRITGATGTGADGTEYTFHASKGVVVATGGFGANVEMREAYNQQWPEIGASVITSNTTAITGDGIRMAEAVGADLVDMGLIQFFPLSDPWTGETNTGVGIMTNLFINKEGKRYVAEDSRRDVLTKANLSQTDGLVYILASQANSLIKGDTNAYGYNVEQMIADGKIYRADTLEELAQQINIDPDTLLDTVDKYNAAFDQGYDEEFGKSVFDSRSRIDEGPFYATPRKPAVHHTMGGIRVDAAAHALDANGNIIPGLFAAGETTGGYHGGNRLGGNAIADCLTNGRIAGTNIALDK